MLQHVHSIAARPVMPMIPDRHGGVGEVSFAGIRLMGVCSMTARDTEVFGEGEPADHLYTVVSGAVRTYKITQDGRRQICAFLLPGDVFGLELGENYSLTAEAVCDSVLAVAKRRTLSGLAERDAEVARRLWVMAAGQLEAARAHMLLLGRQCAHERVAAFLLDLQARLGSGAHVELPMSRNDIADYLGLTIETVSRTLSQFDKSGTIALRTSRQIEVLSRGALRALVG